MRSYYKIELDYQRDLSKALKKIAKPDEYRNYDKSATGYGNDVIRTLELMKFVSMNIHLLQQVAINLLLSLSTLSLLMNLEKTSYSF